MPDEELFFTPTSDDLQARRLCGLAIAFSNAKTPLSSPEIHAAHYPDLSDDSFLRKFSRDREKLVECGLVIRKVGHDGREALWQASESSFADGSFLSPQDALMLDVLCAQLVKDPSFPWRDELRLALAKIDHAYGTLTAVRIAPTRKPDVTLQTMLSCVEHTSCAEISYVNAKGVRTQQTVAPYGHFSFRNTIYFVCAQVDGGEVQQGGLRTYRIDRIERAKQLATKFELPEDFCISDHVLLPFQIGPTVCTVRLAATAESDKDLLAELDRHANLDDEGIREVPASDLTAVARWAIAAGLRPVGPQELTDAYRSVLGEAAQATAQPQPPVDGKAPRKASKGRRGRTGAGNDLREIMALLGSLESEGATLTPEVVKDRLGVSIEHANKLINLISTACVDTNYYLPLGDTEDGGVFLSRSKGVTGRAARLTQNETHALLEALDALHFPADDPLRSDILAAFGSPKVNEKDLQEHVEEVLSSQDNETLEACSRAISEGSGISFSYLSTGQTVATRRQVTPQAVRRANGQWYLDACYGPDASSLRTFRVDRMREVRITAPKAELPQQASREAQAERKVGITFANASPLDLFEWPGLEVLGRHGELIVAQLPYYGGNWLPRHLAACGELASSSDEDLAQRVRTLASALLA